MEENNNFRSIFRPINEFIDFRSKKNVNKLTKPELVKFLKLLAESLDKLSSNKNLISGIQTKFDKKSVSEIQEMIENLHQIGRKFIYAEKDVLMKSGIKPRARDEIIDYIRDTKNKLKKRINLSNVDKNYLRPFSSEIQEFRTYIHKLLDEVRKLDEEKKLGPYRNKTRKSYRIFGGIIIIILNAYCLPLASASIGPISMKFGDFLISSVISAVLL